MPGYRVMLKTADGEREVSVGSLLTIGNPKTEKGREYGFLTGILHMAPAAESVGFGGFNVCPHATPQCKAMCLDTAGRGGIPSGRFVAEGFRNGIMRARVARTVLFMRDRSAFWRGLVAEIHGLKRSAARHGLRAAVRLNGTSDLPYHRMPVVVDGATLAPSVMAMFPDVVFYDYTKDAARTTHLLPDNYHVTLSRSESTPDTAVAGAIARGVSVAVVFGTGRGKALPETWRGARVIDGDVSDLRFTDPKGVIVGLRAKGRARKAAAGFVVPHAL